MDVDAIMRRYQARTRGRRGQLFVSLLTPTKEDRILDLGGGDGGHLESILGPGYNVTVADISARDLSRARERGFDTVVLTETGILPFADDAFDIVFCSSVIEHTTGPKSQVNTCRSGREFERLASGHQARLAGEVRRIGRRYFVQTPNRWFPVEAHTWLPGVQLLPRRVFVGVLLPLLNKTRWPRKTLPDFRLLGARDMRALFPDAVIVRERSLALTLGFTKSLIAVRR